MHTSTNMINNNTSVYTVPIRRNLTGNANGYRTDTERVRERGWNGHRTDTERISNGYRMVTKEKAFSIKERVLQNTR